MMVRKTNVSKVRIGNKEPVPGSFLTLIVFILVLSISSACKAFNDTKELTLFINEYCEVYVEGADINIKLIMGNRESGTGNLYLIPYLSKRLGYFKIIDREQGLGNRELVSCSLLWYVIPMFQKCKLGIGSQFLVPF